MKNFRFSMIVRKGIRDFFASRTGKIIPVILIALLIAAASSSVYTYYIVKNTATVQTADLKLYAGSDNTASCTKYPCATITVTPVTFDSATASFSIFNSAAFTPQPATYYSNFTVVKNIGTLQHTINNVQLSSFGGVAALGNITVWYCTAQTEFLPNGHPVTPGNCPGHSIILSTSSATQTLTGGAQTLAAGAKGYIEVGPAWAGSASGTVTFTISIQWV